ncbi:MAG TPA: TIGR03118 family protein [Bryobacteraceae bacterium]|nr:TIGR03118 family protein [Bryobacteraceae bacterium]
MKKIAACLFLTLSPHLLPAATGYIVHNLVADAKTTATADFYDPRLINPWGNGFSTGSPFWLCDFGISTLYTVADTGTVVFGTPNATTQPLVPGLGGAPNKGSCTGVVSTAALGVTATTPASFQFSAAGKGPATASFIFATEDGIISAWSATIDATQAFALIDNSKTAVYKGLAISGAPTPQLYAANFKAGTIDVFDANFKAVTLASGAFTDPAIPAGFAPFNIQMMGGKLYVTYAKQDDPKNAMDDVPGPGNGYVDVYDFTGKLLSHLTGGSGFFGQPGVLSSPWGIAIAPATFGKFGGNLLVGNFGDGTINAFDLTSGAFQGTLTDGSGKTISIPGLWSINFGNGGSGGDKDTLYFTAGPGGEQHGILGSINANPNVTSTGVTNAAQSGAGIAPNTYMTIKGTDLAVTKRAWATADFGTSGKTLPTSLDGVSVTVNGQPAYVEFVSPVQINILTPVGLVTAGQIQVAVSNGGLTSATVNVPAQNAAPAFFLADAAGHIAAEHGSGALISSTAPAAPGETIALFGNGFGATTPAVTDGQVLSAVAPLTVNPVVTIGGSPANVVFAGLTSTGLYQINVVVPTGLPDGDAAVVASTGGFTSPAGALITIKN